MNIKQKMAEAFDVPKDILLDDVKIVILGDNEINIENYKGIIEYDDNLVRIKTSGKTIKVFGTGLQICAITDEDIQIKGTLKTLELGVS